MIQGDQTATMPDKYVNNQADYNFLHTNGVAVLFKERAYELVELMLKYARQHGDHTFLDVGCRMGYVMEYIIEALPAATAVGIDVVDVFIKRAEKIGDAYIADMHDLPFKDNEFGWIFCCQTLEHAYNVPQALDELFRVAKDGICLSIPLECGKSFELNPSHYAYTEKTSDWLKLITKYEDWTLALAIAKPPSEFNLIFLRRDYG